MEFDHDTLMTNLARYMIPIRMYPGIIKWIQDGVKPGHFLMAIVENDLKESINRADDENVIRLQAYIKFLYNCAPGGCWGSKEKVEEWAKMGGLRKKHQIKSLIELEEENDDGE
jgi:hypothetical protein